MSYLEYPQRIVPAFAVKLAAPIGGYWKGARLWERDFYGVQLKNQLRAHSPVTMIMIGSVDIFAVIDRVSNSDPRNLKLIRKLAYPTA